MATAEENTKTVLAFFSGATGEGDPADLIADDLTYWIAGRPEAFPLAGSHSKEGFGRVLSIIGRNMPDGVDVQVENVVAAGDQVVLETHVHGVSATGKVYDNKVVSVTKLRDGKIVSVHEYLDTMHANEVLAENVA